MPNKTVYLYGSAKDAATRALRRQERAAQGKRDRTTVRCGPRGSWLVRPSRRLAVSMEQVIAHRDTLTGPLSRGSIQLLDENGRVMDWKALLGVSQPSLPGAVEDVVDAPESSADEMAAAAQVVIAPQAETEPVVTTEPAPEGASAVTITQPETLPAPPEVVTDGGATLDPAQADALVEKVAAEVEAEADPLSEKIAVYMAMSKEELEAAYLELLQAEEDGAEFPDPLKKAMEARINGEAPAGGVDYSKMSAADLRAEVTKRGLTVADSRKRDLLIAALQEDDAKKA